MPSGEGLLEATFILSAIYVAIWAFGYYGWPMIEAKRRKRSPSSNS